MVPGDEVPATPMMVFSGGSQASPVSIMTIVAAWFRDAVKPFFLCWLWVFLQVLVLAAVVCVDGGSSSGARFAMTSSKVFVSIVTAAPIYYA